MARKKISLLTLIAFASLILSQPVFTRTTPAKMNILVYPFRFDGDTNFSWIAAGLTDTVISDLHNINAVSVFSDEDRKKAIREMELGMTGLFDESTVVKVGNVIGANVVFTGSIQVSGSVIRINARLLNVETTKIENTIKLDGTTEKIFELQDRVVTGLMTEAEKIQTSNLTQVKFSSDEIKKIESGYKPKREAYELYSKGLELRDSNPDAALSMFLKAAEIDPGYADALIEAGHTAGSILNRFPEALDYLARAASMLEKSGGTSSDDYARVLQYTGEVYRYKGEHDRAMEYYSKSLEIREKLGLQNTISYADTLSNMGILYRSKGDGDKAVEYYTRAEKILLDLGLQNSDGYASLMNNMGLASISKGDPDKALEYFMVAKNTRERLSLQKSDGYATILNNIGIVYSSQLQYDKSLDYFMQAKQAYDGIKLQETVAYGVLQSNLAGVYENLGQKELAGEYYRKSYDTLTKIGYQGKWRDNALKNAKRLGK
ncbi:MAG TPA: tetratricopeptide repeat protein [Spirochaetota bacterium]|nr:tetratricopeptide repeat protein [Spirochaetota bacterium]